MVGQGFDHSAVLYQSQDELVQVARAFLGEGLREGGPILVVESRANIAALREALRDDAARVEFHDSAQWLRAPGPAMTAYRRWVGRADGERVWILGEPPWRRRSEAAVREWARYESVFNRIFASVPGVRLTCPYDASVLPDEILAYALQTHPRTLDRNGEAPSQRYLDPAAFSRLIDSPPLEEPSEPVVRVRLPGLAGLQEARWEIRAWAAETGLAPDRVADLITATNEAATNGITYGRGEVRLQLWVADGHAVCEIESRDGGVVDPFTGYLDPGLTAVRGRGLWLARELCDLVELRSTDRRVVVRLHVALPGSRRPASDSGALIDAATQAR